MVSMKDEASGTLQFIKPLARHWEEAVACFRFSHTNWPFCREELGKLQEASAEAVLALNEAAEQEAEAAAALEEADKKLRALKAERDKMKDFEEREAQHAQVVLRPLLKTCTVLSYES